MRSENDEVASTYQKRGRLMRISVSSLREISPLVRGAPLILSARYPLQGGEELATPCPNESEDEDMAPKFDDEALGGHVHYRWLCPLLGRCSGRDLVPLIFYRKGCGPWNNRTLWRISFPEETWNIPTHLRH